MAEFRSICNEVNIEFDLFIIACQMLKEREWNKLKLSVVQCFLYKTTEFSTVHTNRKAEFRYAGKIKAAAKLSSTFNESINKLKE